jgi:hypothetical protein
MSSEGDNILLPAEMPNLTNQTFQKKGKEDVVGEEEEEEDMEVDELMGQEDQKDNAVGNVFEEDMEVEQESIPEVHAGGLLFKSTDDELGSKHEDGMDDSIQDVEAGLQVQ